MERFGRLGKVRFCGLEHGEAWQVAAIHGMAGEVRRVRPCFVLVGYGRQGVFGLGQVGSRMARSCEAWHGRHGKVATIYQRRKSMIYKWKSGARAPVPAQVAGEVCEQMSANGELTPRALVDASRPEDAPLHAAFEWDDEKAAEAYREGQAAYIIRSIEGEHEGMEEPVRAFFTVPTMGGEAYQYHSVEAVLKDANSREALLARAKRELEAFVRKYGQLEELAEIIASVEKLRSAA